MEDLDITLHSAIDMHCHSKHSGESSEWFLKKMRVPESWTEPQALYDLAKKRGMQFVTITDHNVIDGCLEIAHLDDVVISSEIATWFPDSKCKLDILCVDITESQFTDLIKLQDNVYELVDYLNQHNIFHSLAHPLYNMNGKLDLEHFERCMLMFKNVEVLNGARTKQQNLTVERVVQQLTPEIIDRLANKYDLEPRGNEPWKKAITSGSDDHGGLLIGTNGTVVPKVANFEEFKAKVANCESDYYGTIGTSHTLAHNIYRAAYMYVLNVVTSYSPKKGDPFHYMLMKLLFNDDSHKPSAFSYIKRKIKKKFLGRSEPDKSPGKIFTIMKEEANKLLKEKPHHKRLLTESLPEKKDDLNRVVFNFMSDLANRVTAKLSRDIINAAKDAKISKIVDLIPALGTIHTLLLPYYVAYGVTNSSNKVIKAVSDTYLPQDQRVRSVKKVAMFTDTYDEVNGVAVIVKQMAQEAKNAGVEMLVIKSGPEKDHSDGNIFHFQSVADVSLPEYPETKLHFPSLLDIIDWCDQQNFTSIHAAVPGSMGLLALLISRILHIPFVSTYHTEITDYVRYLTGSNALAKYASKYAKWFYSLCEVIFAPSEASRMSLVKHGIFPDLIHFIPWGVDMELFNPAQRDETVWKEHEVNRPLKLLYVGRISKEKNLDVLAKSFIKLCEERQDCQLVLAGGGPYRPELQEMLKDYPVTFLGYLDQKELAQYYAASDIFVFPSTTDTFGNVIIEALASGLPVIVSDMGGPKENMEHEVTGLITKSLDSKDLYLAMKRLVEDDSLRRKMSEAARPAVKGKSRRESFSKYWDLHK
jgi:glycosyltransferase involved in cell wall biosynthesis